MSVRGRTTKVTQKLWTGPYQLVGGGDSAMVYGPTGKVVGPLNEWAAARWVIELNKSFEDGYQHGLGDMALLINPKAGKSFDNT